MRCRTRLAGALSLATALSLTGCAEMLRSDSANASHRAHQARTAALLGNQEASRQAAPAQPMRGDPLVQMLAGRSHVSEYRRRANDPKPYYAIYQHFRADGVLVSADTYGRRAPEWYTLGLWRVTDDVLCMTGMDGGRGEQCFTLRREPTGAVQYWIHNPGDMFHGLITSRVSIIRDGQQTPEFVTTQSPFQ